VRADDDVDALREEMVDRYGDPPGAVESLLDVARFRARCRRAGLTDVTLQGGHVRFAPVDLPESGRLRLQRLYPKSVVKDALRTILVPRPRTGALGGQPVRDVELLRWAREVVDAVVDRATPGANPERAPNRQEQQ
jgi:transcription-repair coupling factor (superfamily II helicase)